MVLLANYRNIAIMNSTLVMVFEEIVNDRKEYRSITAGTFGSKRCKSEKE